MAVIYINNNNNNNKRQVNKCIRLNLLIAQGVVFVLFLVLFNNGAVMANPSPHGCEIVRKDITQRGINGVILDRPSTGPFCGESSCCSPDMELELYKTTQYSLNKFLRDSITKLHQLIDFRARKFDGLFRDMMNSSKREFHAMFQRTYGKIYLQNSDVFSDFFNELETYYKKGTIRLSETLESFFGILYQRMFKVINSQYIFDEKYLECVSDHMVDMQPFGDVPHKLSMQLKRSFVATRTYYKSLLMAADVVIKMINIKLDDNCTKDLIIMQYCGICKGQQGVGTCSNYCTNIMETCLRYHMAFSQEWDNLIDALDKVADRLVGPFNIEIVVEPLNIKISEAIMNFQESGNEVSKKIYSICGKPTLARKKRNATTDLNNNNKNNNNNDDEQTEINPFSELKFQPINNNKMNGNKKKKLKKVNNDDDEVPSLEKLIREIKMKVRDTRQFWLHLPYQYCNNPNITASPSDDGKCWNGTEMGYYEKTKLKSWDNLKAPSLLNELNYTMQILTDRLRKAHQGDEVEIVDDSEEPLDGSGSGSGDGNIIDEEQNQIEIGGGAGGGGGVNPNPDIIVESPDGYPPNEPSTTTTTKKPQDTKQYASKAPTISLSKALIQYLLPIVLVWFGGAISDLL